MTRTLLALALLAGCSAPEKGDDTSGTASTEDQDNDGYTAEEGDCNDDDPNISPSATDSVGDDIDQNCDGTDGMDGDEDGYASEISGGNDCDDSDGKVNAGADELCDGIDNNCDGSIDEDSATDAITWYADVDSDGYGDPATMTNACEQPSTYVENAGDCDDTDADAYPGAAEYCDGHDNDCDDEIDEDDAVDAKTWYLDSDSDGFGDADSTDVDCDQPTGYVSDDTDCDDTNAEVSPDGTEVCDDIDNDCDGTRDEDDASDAGTWCPDDDGDGFGDPDGAVSACERPSGHTDDANDCDDADASVNPDAADTCEDGVDSDCDGYDGSCAPTGTLNLSSADAKLVGEAASDGAGSAVSCEGDVNGDGYADILVGAYLESTGGTYAGAAYVVHGPVSGSVSLSSATAKFTGEADSDLAGEFVSLTSDVNGDGYTDALVTARYDDTSGTYAGAIYLVHGPMTGTMSLSSAAAKVVADDAYDFAGNALSGGVDVDGDGYDDFLVGAPYAGSTTDGITYLLLGPVTGQVEISTIAQATLVETRSGNAGKAVAFDGDLDGDGVADYIVGSPYDETVAYHAGAVFVVHGPITGKTDLSSADLTLLGEDSYDDAGWGADFAGDVNNDGYDDIIVGAQGDDTSADGAGAAYVIFGPVSSGTTSLSTADAKLLGSGSYNSGAGSRVAAAGDIDQDGHDDILIGAMNYGTQDDGRVYLAYGPVSGQSNLSAADAIFKPESGHAEAGSSLSGGGDVNGDGYPDFVIGAQGTTTSATQEGAAYLFLGGVR